MKLSVPFQEQFYCIFTLLLRDVLLIIVQVKGTTPKDAGRYRVTAENQAGADSASFDVKVKSECLTQQLAKHPL